MAVSAVGEQEREIVDELVIAPHVRQTIVQADRISVMTQVREIAR